MRLFLNFTFTMISFIDSESLRTTTVSKQFAQNGHVSDIAAVQCVNRYVSLDDGCKQLAHSHCPESPDHESNRRSSDVSLCR